MSDEVLVEHADGVTVITINRPQARNAVNRAVSEGIGAALEEFESRKDLTVAVITGAGGTFCSGMDLKAFVAGENVALEDRGFAGITKLPPRKPVIAAVEGVCVAGGTEVLQATDIRVAAESASFGLFEVRRGLFPVGGSTVRLARQIPRTHAMEMLLTGRRYTAAEARDIGLVGSVVPDGTALKRALELAEAVNEAAPLAVEAVKRSVYECADLSEQDGLAKELEIGWPIFATEDAKEGPRAFAERRAPVYRRH